MADLRSFQESSGDFGKLGKVFGKGFSYFVGEIKHVLIFEHTFRTDWYQSLLWLGGSRLRRAKYIREKCGNLLAEIPPLQPTSAQG